jgi:hypothetical protein
VVFDKRKTSEESLTAGEEPKWGWPPLPLIPSRVAHRLAAVRLPNWLAKLLGAPGATASALNQAAWDHLPDDAGVRERVRRYVLDLVAARAAELHDVPLSGPPVRTPESLGIALWPARSRNALLRAGVGHDPDRLASLTFGELLDTRQIGVRTALETAVLLEVSLQDAAFRPIESAAAEPRTAAQSTISVARWGEPGAPLLPQSLRRAFAQEVLPPWLLQDLHLPPDAAALALDSSVWRHLDRNRLPARAERFLLGLVTYRVADIRNLRVIEGSWRPDLRPEDVPWPTRVYNALLSAELLDSARLERVTYGELLAVPAMGVKSALEFAVVADAMVAAPARVLDETMRIELMAAAEEDWVERVRADDPRFRDVVPPYPGSLSELFEEALSNPEGSRAHALAQSLSHIRARALEISSEPIDLALVRLLKSLGDSDRDVAIVIARYGWKDGGPRTLQEVAEEFSITRERVRQIAARAVDRISRSYLPQTERAVQAVTDHSPIAADDAARLLVDQGLSTVPIDPTSLKAAAELLGYDVSFHVDPGDGVPYVLAQGLVGTGPVFSAARREAGRVGVSNIEEVQAELAASGHTMPTRRPGPTRGPWFPTTRKLPPNAEALHQELMPELEIESVSQVEYSSEAVSRILHSSTKIEFLDDEWFWMPGIPPERNRLRNVTQRMLSVTPRLDVQTIRQGVRRRYRFMRIDLVPPITILKAFYSAHSEFVLNDDGTVESAEPLDYRDALGEVEQVFVEVLRASPTGLIDRAELEEAVTGRGVNASTFSVFTTYSPILDHPAKNVWCLRGHAVDPVQLEALRAMIATRSRQRRTLAYGWDEDGRLWLTVVLANISSPVVGIPASISRYVAGRRFQARTQEGTPAGVIAIDESGASWGYGPFLRRRGAEPGDALTLRFDLVSAEVILSLDDESALVDEAG